MIEGSDGNEKPSFGAEMTSSIPTFLSTTQGKRNWSEGRGPPKVGFSSETSRNRGKIGGKKTASAPGDADGTPIRERPIHPIHY